MEYRPPNDPLYGPAGYTLAHFPHRYSTIVSNQSTVSPDSMCQPCTLYPQPFHLF